MSKVVSAGGKNRLDLKIAKYNQAARRANWVIFRDSDGKCPVELRGKLIDAIAGPVADGFCLRIAHTMTEAWLLADTDGFSAFFHVPRGKVPRNPEQLVHAKRTILRLCSASSRALRDGIATPDAETGPAYVSRMNEFAAEYWNVQEAARHCPSLARAIKAIRSLPVL
ncbi:MAG: hypothetical protein QM662_07680 [Gordonia sp. (in: high G+C Gram-positive bacteria)]